MASPPPNRTVLLVEPWWTGSHRTWAEGLIRHSRHRFELLADQPSGWKDTVDHSAERLAARVEVRPDVVVSSSMMNLEVFLDRSGLSGVPAVQYMHENQLTYDRSRPDLERGQTNWRSVQLAQVAAFNSRFHLDDFFAALPRLGIDPSRAAGQRATSLVLPVGIEAGEFSGADLRDGGPPVIAWNHRWEGDKDPDAFLAGLEAISDLSWRLVLLGEWAGRDRFASRIEPLTDRIVHVGHAPRPAYAALLRRADLVVSTARQEFFGVAVVEAMAAGAIPVVPDDLAYPEVLGSELAECLYPARRLADALRAAITDRDRIHRLRPVVQSAAARFDWQSVIGGYDRLIDSMI